MGFFSIDHSAERRSHDVYQDNGSAGTGQRNRCNEWSVTMPNGELGVFLMLDMDCPHCREAVRLPVASVLNDDELLCTECRKPIERATAEWKTFRIEFNEALKRLQPLYENLP